jgi:dCTP deaminase
MVRRERAGTIDTRLPFPEDILEKVNLTASGLVIGPGEHYLATTLEYFKLPDNIAAEIKGKSSVGRLGIDPITAGWVDPGFEGEITYEIYSVGNAHIRVFPGMYISQAIFYKLDRPAHSPYNKRVKSLYVGQMGATAPKTSNLYDSPIHVVDGSESLSA